MDLILRFSYCSTQGSLDPSTVPFQSIWQVMLHITHLLKFWFWHMGEMTVTKFIFQQTEEKSCLFLGNLSISQAWAGLQCLNSEGYTIIKNQEIFLMIFWELLKPFLWSPKMNLALGQNDCYLCYILAIWEGPLCVTANRSLYVCIHRFMNPWMLVSLYPRIHVSPHPCLLGFSYSWTSLNSYPSVDSLSYGLWGLMG